MQTLKYISSSAVVIERDNNHIQIKYIDVMARPDLANKKSGWIKVDDNSIQAGDVVNASFTPELKRGLEFIKTTISK